MDKIVFKQTCFATMSDNLEYFGKTKDNLDSLLIKTDNQPNQPKVKRFVTRHVCFQTYSDYARLPPRTTDSP